MLYDYNETQAFELKNMLERGEIDETDLTEDQLEMLEAEEERAARSEYAKAYSAYMSEWT